MKLSGNLEECLRRDADLSRAAQVFTAVVNVAELANGTNDQELGDYLAVAGNALLLPLAYLVGKLGPCPDLPQDLRNKITAVLADFKLRAPALAHRLAEQLQAPAPSAAVEINHSNGRLYV